MKRLALTLLTSLPLLAGCTMKFATPEESVSSETTSMAVMKSSVDLNLHPMNKTVCDPFDGGNSTQVMAQGVQGTLYYATAGMPRMYSANDYVSFAKKSDKTLFFADINVPTRAFTEGFSTQTTGVLSDDSGNKLIEYFGIKFETSLQLAENDAEGDYELALLSDDGARLKMQDPVDNTWKEIINNDGDHPTQMGCATRVINMTHRTSIPLEITYYQGPRYHIANVLMWRKSSTAGKDALCGQSGNNYFFNPDAGSVPLKPYNDLLARGWAPIAPANFWLNNVASYNPCVQGTKPVISNFAVSETTLTDVFLAWTTDIPASTQVRLINQSTGQEILTTSDNLLRTDHSVHISGLQPNVTYSAQAASVSQDLGNSLSASILFTTH